MSIFTRGFSGRRRDSSRQLPPGQYLTNDFPVLSAGPTPRIPLDAWQFTVTTELGQTHQWSWSELMALPAEAITVDIHCVTRWSKLDTAWRGVSLDTLLADVETEADYAMAHSYGGYSTNLPLEDLLDGKAWIAYEYDGEGLAPAHGGPARMLVPDFGNNLATTTMETHGASSGIRGTKATSHLATRCFGGTAARDAERLHIGAQGVGVAGALSGAAS
jgi:hypothetical protein